MTAARNRNINMRAQHARSAIFIDNNPTFKDREELAADMRHSVTTNLKHYVKHEDKPVTEDDKDKLIKQLKDQTIEMQINYERIIKEQKFKNK